MGFLQTLSKVARRSPPPDAAAVVERADALIGQGRRAEALARLDEHAARLDDPIVWTRALALRMALIGEVAAASAPRPDWPPALADPFPGITGIPEIAASELDWRVLGGAVLHHGSLIVRGLVDAATAARLRDGIDEALDACALHQDGRHDAFRPCAHIPVPLPEGTPLYFGRQFLRNSGAVWAVEAPALFAGMLAVYREQGVLSAIAGYLGEQPIASVGKTVLRRVQQQTAGSFHQDGAFMGADIRSINVWTTLSDCGEDAPGLEIVGRRLSSIVPTGTPGAGFDWSVSREEVDRAAAGAPVAVPMFAAGDAILFDHMMLHATYANDRTIKPRYALESWFFAPSAHPADQVPIVI